MRVFTDGLVVTLFKQLRLISISNTVVPCHVGGGFRWQETVMVGQTILEKRDAHYFDRGAKTLVHFKNLALDGLVTRVSLLDLELFDNADGDSAKVGGIVL